MNTEKTAVPQVVTEEGNQIIMTQLDDGQGPMWQPYPIAYLPILDSLIKDGSLVATVVVWSHFERKWQPLSEFVEGLRFMEQLWRD